MPLFFNAIISMTQARLVPCGYTGAPACEPCHFFILARDIITYILETIVPLAALLIIVGGVLIMVAGGSANLAVRGKKLIRVAIIGIIGALGSWLIINTIIVFVVNPTTFPFPWYAWDMSCPIVEIDLAEAGESDYTILNDISLPGISPGDMLRFAFTYTNISSETLSNLVITTDYDQTHTNLIKDISLGGISDGNKIVWKIGQLKAGESVTVTYDFVLGNNFSDLVTQEEISPPSTLDDIKTSVKVNYFRDKIIVTTNQTSDRTLDEPVDLMVPTRLFAERSYYLIRDSDSNGQASPGDELKYDVEYANPTAVDFNNVFIVSDYDQGYINIRDIHGEGIDDGNKIIWSLGALSAGQPSRDNPGCLGYNFTILSNGANFISSVFIIESDGRIMEGNNDKVFIELE